MSRLDAAQLTVESGKSVAFPAAREAIEQRAAELKFRGQKIYGE